MIEAAGWELRQQAGLRVPTFVYETDAMQEDLRRLEPQFLLPTVVLADDGRPAFELQAPDLAWSLGQIGPFAPAEVERLEAAQRDLGSCLVLIATRDGKQVFSPRAFCADLLLDFHGALARAEDFVRRTRHGDAIRELQGLVRGAGTPLGVHLLIGKIALAQGDAAGAAEAAGRELEGAIRPSGEPIPAASRAFLLLGKALEELGRTGEALHAYRRGLGLRPNHVEALVATALLFAREGQPDEAHRLLARAAACCPGHPLLASARADASALLGTAEGALIETLAREAEGVDLQSEVSLPPPPARPGGEPSGAGGERVYRVLCHVAHCDGEVAPAERALLEEYRRRLGIDAERATLLEEEGARGASLFIGPSALEQELILDGMIDMAASDGRLAPRELRDLRAIGLQLGLSEEELARRLSAVFSGHVPLQRSRPQAEAEQPPRVLRTLSTAAGELEVLEPRQALVQRLAALWPFGLEATGQVPTLRLSRGGERLPTLLLRQAPMQQARAAGCALINRVRIAYGVGFYRRVGYEGLLVPMGALRESAEGFEPGIAFAAAPLGDAEALADEGDFIDRRLGSGSSAMIGAMLAGLGPQADRVGLLPIAAPQSLDAESGLEEHVLWLDLAILGDAVLCLHEALDGELPLWEALVLGGVRRVYHLPCRIEP